MDNAPKISWSLNGKRPRDFCSLGRNRHCDESPGTRTLNPLNYAQFKRSNNFRCLCLRFTVRVQWRPQCAGGGRALSQVISAQVYGPVGAARGA
jgi:hypothetical protein